MEKNDEAPSFEPGGPAETVRRFYDASLNARLDEIERIVDFDDFLKNMIAGNPQMAALFSSPEALKVMKQGFLQGTAENESRENYNPANYVIKSENIRGDSAEVSVVLSNPYLGLIQNVTEFLKRTPGGWMICRANKVENV